LTQPPSALIRPEGGVITQVMIRAFAPGLQATVLWAPLVSSGRLVNQLSAGTEVSYTAPAPISKVMVRSGTSTPATSPSVMCEPITVSTGAGLRP
jgi:hypothetical protein